MKKILVVVICEMKQIEEEIREIEWKNNKNIIIFALIDSSENIVSVCLIEILFAYFCLILLTSTFCKLKKAIFPAAFRFVVRF